MKLGIGWLKFYWKFVFDKGFYALQKLLGKLFNSSISHLVSFIQLIVVLNAKSNTDPVIPSTRREGTNGMGVVCVKIGWRFLVDTVG